MDTSSGVTFSELVVKIASRCNLKCSYCYMYEAADQSWRAQPHFMAPEVWQAVADRAAEHAKAHNLTSFRVIFHGGEPLLAGTRQILRMASVVRSAMPPAVRLQLSMQTNGVLLTEKVLRELQPAAVYFGLSFDGNGNERRLVKNGKSSLLAARRAITLLNSPEFRSSFGGLLTVVDTAVDPVRTYEELRALDPPNMDFLPVLSNYTSLPPPGTGEWLAAVFDRWHADDGAPMIRLFHVIISRLLGRDVRAGFIGPYPTANSCVVNTDGSAELLDALRSAYDGAVSTGMNITTHSLDEIGTHPGYIRPEPCQTCKSCAIFNTCGGGYYPDRYSPVNSFDNPSVYCDDLMYIIRHIEGRLREYDLL